MNVEQNRLDTFAAWPPTAPAPPPLARLGFFATRAPPTVQCFACHLRVPASPADALAALHRARSPACPFLVAPPAGNVPGALAQLGVQRHRAPAAPRFAAREARLRSFAAWPPAVLQTGEALAAAGFYFEGVGDLVRCFHCDGGLRHWDPGDDPWTEHARWFPRCSFVLLVKGREFVSACAVEANESSLEEVDQKRNKAGEKEVRDELLGPAAILALNIGLNVGQVRRAIKEKLERTGCGYQQPDALVEAALNLQCEGAEEEEGEGDGEVKRVVSNVLDRLIHAGCREEGAVVAQPVGPAAMAQPVGPAERGGVSLEEENRLLREARLCKICMDVEVGIVFLPCGHLATCVNCAPNLEDCPVCRSAIKATVRTFLS